MIKLNLLLFILFQLNIEVIYLIIIIKKKMRAIYTFQPTYFPYIFIKNINFNLIFFQSNYYFQYSQTNKKKIKRIFLK